MDSGAGSLLHGEEEGVIWLMLEDPCGEMLQNPAQITLRWRSMTVSSERRAIASGDVPLCCATGCNTVAQFPQRSAVSAHGNRDLKAHKRIRLLNWPWKTLQLLSTRSDMSDHKRRAELAHVLPGRKRPRPGLTTGRHPPWQQQHLMTQQKRYFSLFLDAIPPWSLLSRAAT